MVQSLDRRDFLKLAGLGGVVFASGLAGCSGVASRAAADEFYFLVTTLMTCSLGCALTLSPTQAKPRTAIPRSAFQRHVSSII